MAVTKGHGNPNWTREEVILALELYQKCEDSIPGPGDERVENLSAELRSLPYHASSARNESFRNPDGVAFKLQNIRQVATGRGLGNTSQMDREVWADLGGDPEATRDIAKKIRQSIEVVKPSPEPEEDEFSEGRAVTEAHKRIERSRSIRRKLLKKRKESGRLTCEICGVTGENLPDEVRDSIFEAHHKVALSRTGETITKLSDVALLCAVCHRLIHRVVSVRKAWVSIEDLKAEIVNDQRRF